MARQQNHLTYRNINCLARVVDLEAVEFTPLRFENRFVFQEPEKITTPAGKAEL